MASSLGIQVLRCPTLAAALTVVIATQDFAAGRLKREFEGEIETRDVLVSSIRPVNKFADLTSDEVADLFLCVHRVGPVLQQAFDGTALTITLQDGKDAGQTVEHTHVHILPRRPGDFSVNNDIYVELAKHDKPEEEQQWRSYEEMKEEASKLEKFFLAQEK